MNDSDRLAKLIKAVDTLCMNVLVLAHICDTRGNLFSETDAKKFTHQWNECRELIDEIMEADK